MHVRRFPQTTRQPLPRRRGSAPPTRSGNISPLSWDKPLPLRLSIADKDKKMELGLAPLTK